ncbi:MAG: NUDIX hydrolase, partial [Gemmatimonadota bacterium]|nr:NUDIX hydrolase [Gemmatimonadota bacterium]
MTIALWNTVDSIVTYKDRWLTVRSDRCVTADGAIIAPYHVLEYPDWVHIIALTVRNEIVLVEQYRHAVGAILTELPAGSMEPADSSPAD